MTILGMNPTEVDGLAESLESHATAIQNAATTCATTLKELEWVGDDATAFRTKFDTIIENGLTAAEAIRKLGIRAGTEASQQRTTSMT